MLIVSHDRGFLDEVVSDVVQLKHRQLHYYRGGATEYLATVREQYVSQKRAFDAQQLQRQQMREVIDRYDPSKNSSADNKKNKRHQGAVAAAKVREQQPCEHRLARLVPPPS